MRVLIVDDEPNIVSFVRKVLEKEGAGVEVATSFKGALDLISKTTFDIAFLDLRLPDGNGMDLLRKLREVDPFCFPVVITAYGDVKTAVEALKMGAMDFIEKPFGVEMLVALLEKAKRIVPAMRAVEVVRGRGVPEIVATSSAMKRVLKLAESVAKTDSTVLITGESGTGKELLARYIHASSLRRNGPFVPINCSAIPSDLLETELFGYEKGAFTGADKPKKGKWVLADGGTLFLDEISEMPLNLQPKILRAVEYGEIFPLGAEKPKRADVRIISATNRDLRRLVEEGKFREDLYWRINVVSIHIPPLRERPEDIPPLVAHFIRKLSGELGKRIKGITPRAMEALVGYRFPGNIRELRNIIERAIILCGGEEIDVPHLPPEVIS